MNRLVLIISVYILIPASCFPQSLLEKKVRIGQTHGTVGFLLDEIAQKGHFFFSYGDAIETAREVSLEGRKQSVEKYLEDIFGESVYSIEYGNKILLRPKRVQTREIIISGTVVEAGTEVPLPGVTIYVPGTDPLVGVVSDKNGHFRIRLPAGMEFIRFSSIGYEQRSLTTGNILQEHVQLNPRSELIEEVIIEHHTPPIGRESNFAVGRVQKEQLEMLNTPTLENILQGTVAGVFAKRNSGMPGATVQVNIRGNQSLINSDPVYYLDGMRVQWAVLNALSTQDIASMQVVRDAAGTALYGSTAANGVVLIETARAGEPGVSVTTDHYTGWQELWKGYDLLDGEEFLEYFNIVKWYSKAFDSIDASNIQTTDWVSKLFHKGLVSETHFTLSDRKEHSGWYLSSNYLHHTAMISEIGFDRYTLNFSGDQSFKNVTLRENLFFSHLNYQGIKEGAFLSDFNNPILSSLLMVPIYDPEDSIGPVIGTGDTLGLPTDNAELVGNHRNNYIGRGNLTMHWDISNRLRYEGIFGGELLFQDNTSYNNSPPILIAGPDFNFYRNDYKIVDVDAIMNHQMKWTMLAGEKHHLVTSLGAGAGIHTSDWIPGRQMYFTSRKVFYDGAEGEPVEYYASLGYKSNFRHGYWIATADYNFSNKYYIDLGLREDVTMFPFNQETTRVTSVLYPSVALGWMFSEENFIAQADFLEYGKLRLSWGRSGNSPYLDYSFYAKMMRDLNYIFAFGSKNSISNSALIRQANEKYYLEKETAYDAGFDVGLWGNRFFITFDYFYNILEEGKLYPIDNPLPLISELNQRRYFRINYPPPAKILNTGIELMLRCRFTYSKGTIEIGTNLSHINNKILSIPEIPISFLYNPEFDLISANIPGETAGSFYGYYIERLFRQEDTPDGKYVTNQPFYVNEEGRTIYAQNNAEPGDYKFADLNGDARIDQEDKMILGSPFPDLSGGVFLSGNYGHWQVSLMFQGTYGNEIFNATKRWLYNPSGISNWSSDIVNSYRKPRYNNDELIDEGVTDTDLHRFDPKFINNNFRISQFYIEDGSYMRLKNLRIAYTLDFPTMNKVHMSSARLYLAGQNLLTLTNYSGLDPEVGGWGIDAGIYPQPRTFLAGVELTFK